MLNQLTIGNFMVFQHLEIPTLKRVNLISGKNNVGKTTLLDAIRILKADDKEQSRVVNDILIKRDLHTKYYDCYESLVYRDAQANLENEELFKINSLFLNRKEQKSGTQFINGFAINRSRNFLNPKEITKAREKLVYVSFQFNFDNLKELWNNIDLTPKEDDVLKILRDTIEPDIIRFSVKDKSVIVRLKGIEEPFPLKTLGDGVQRILMIAMSLANAQNSILLIDEIEMGLHYTVLEKLWAMIFKYAHLWDIQVFVTTHSQDALKTFHRIADQDEYKEEAQFIRLQRSRKGEIEAILFDEERLESSLEMKIDIR